MTRKLVIACCIAALAGTAEFWLGTPSLAATYALAVLTGIFIGMGVK